MAVQNVLLVTVDSLRYDLFSELREAGEFNFTEYLTPTAFSEAVANGPNTPTSFPTILTSTHPLMYGGYAYLDGERPFVAKTFRNAGFRTGGFHSNPHLGRNKNYHTGFEVFSDTAEGSDSVATIKDRVERILNPDSLIYRVLRRSWHYFNMTTKSSAYGKAPTVTASAREWLEEDVNADESFFAWLHFMDAHYPFIPSEDFLDAAGGNDLSRSRIADLNGKMQENPKALSDGDIADLKTLYEGEIRLFDHHFTNFLDYLDASDRLNETAVVVTADHGEAFGEHGRFGHHPYMYDELLHVPLLIHTPGEDAHTVEEQVSLIDIGPTIQDLAGIETPEAAQGESLVPYLGGGETSTHDEHVSLGTASDGDELSARTTSWKCLWHVETDDVELYDLDNDPREKCDVSDENPKRVRELEEHIDAYLEAAEKTNVDLPTVEENNDVQQRLQDLGYR